MRYRRRRSFSRRGRVRRGVRRRGRSLVRRIGYRL